MWGRSHAASQGVEPPVYTIFSAGETIWCRRLKVKPPHNKRFRAGGYQVRSAAGSDDPKNSISCSGGGEFRSVKGSNDLNTQILLKGEGVMCLQSKGQSALLNEFQCRGGSGAVSQEVKPPEYDSVVQGAARFGHLTGKPSKYTCLGVGVKSRGVSQDVNPSK